MSKHDLIAGEGGVLLLTWLSALCCHQWEAVCFSKDAPTRTWTWCGEVAWSSWQLTECCQTPPLNWEQRGCAKQNELGKTKEQREEGEMDLKVFSVSVFTCCPCH